MGVGRRLVGAAFLLGGFLDRPVAARNPIIDEGLADPSVKVFGGRAYIYGTHDFSPANTTWIAKDWHVYSSSDLVTWVDAGVVLDDNALAWRSLSDQDWAPDAVFFNNQYYFYSPAAPIRSRRGSRPAQARVESRSMSGAPPARWSEPAMCPPAIGRGRR